MKIFDKIIVLAILTILFACSKNNDSNNQATNPVLSVKLVDSPAVYDAVNVEILGMQANMGTGWVVLPVEHPNIYNLQEFTNGNTLLLIEDRNIATGMMTELRLILGTNNTVIVDGISYELTTPSGQTSGYKIKMGPQMIEASGMYRVVIDFDVNVSVHETSDGKYMLKPVVSGYLDAAVGGIKNVE